MRLPVRLLCSKIHLYVGLVLGIVLVVISVTGSALVFRTEIDRLLNPEMLQVEPSSDAVALAEVLTAVKASVPDGVPRLIRFPRTPDAPYQIFLADERHAFVDPGNGHVLGVRGDEEGMMNTLFALHTKFLAGQTGEHVIGVVGLLMVLLAITGVVLWWPSLELSWRRLRRRLVIGWKRGPWRLNYDLHRAGGFYTALFLILVAATGAALVFYAEAGVLLNAVTASDPLPDPPRLEGPHPGSAPPAADLSIVDEALGTARRELPEAEATFISLPLTADAPLAVRMRTPPEWHPNGRSYVYLDPTSGRVLRTDDMRSAQPGTKLLHLAYPLHIGAVGSTVIRVLYVLFGLAPALLSVTGTLIWYKRWRKRDLRERNSSSRGVAPRRPTRSITAELPMSLEAVDRDR